MAKTRRTKSNFERENEDDIARETSFFVSMIVAVAAIAFAIWLRTFNTAQAELYFVFAHIIVIPITMYIMHLMIIGMNDSSDTRKGKKTGLLVLLGVALCLLVADLIYVAVTDGFFVNADNGARIAMMIIAFLATGIAFLSAATYKYKRAIYSC